MAKLDVGDIDDRLLEWFAHRAKRLGQNEEQFARTLIEREAKSEQAWQNLEDNSSKMRERLKSIGRYESSAAITKHPDR
jgi:ribosomal protein L32E